MKPAVGRIVHYVSYGTPGGEYGKECRAAIITAVRDQPGEADLAVFNPSGMFFNQEVELHEYGGIPVEGGTTGLCGGLDFPGGTWHWPARVE